MKTAITGHSQLATADEATASAKIGAEWDEASFFYKWTYSVVNPMLTKGEQKHLQQEDLMRLPASDKSRKLISEFQEAYKHRYN
jgi:hypothetical protein